MKKPRQESLSLTLSKEIDVICGRFEAEFRAGKKPNIETFLAGLPKVDQPPLFKELLRLEIDLAGIERTLSPKDYLQRFPEHATLVNEVIAGAVADSNAKDPTHKSTYSVSGSPRGQATETQDELRKSIASNVEIAMPAGSQLGRYRIERELGKGAMGVVYLAEDSQIGRKVALKIPKKSALEQPDALERFYREARMLGTLHHPNICPVYDVGAIDGTHYLTMAWIPGKPVSSLINPKKLLPPRQVAMLVRKIAQALAEAHTHGVIHRDLKPANVMLDQRNEPVVMDFGLARQMKTAEDARLTQDGAILGTPVYMAPEQIRGELNLVGPRSDIYALSVILYQFLTGELPFNGPIMAVFAQVLTEQPRRPSEIRADVDPALEAICLKMMAKEIDKRYGSMKEVVTALAEFLKSGSASGTQATASVSEAPLPIIVTAVPAVGRTAQKSRSKSFGGIRWPNKRTTIIGTAGFAFLMLLGVIIIIRNRNGTETKIETNRDQIGLKGTQKGDKTTIEIDDADESATGTRVSADVLISNNNSNSAVGIRKKIESAVVAKDSSAIPQTSAAYDPVGTAEKLEQTILPSLVRVKDSAEGPMAIGVVTESGVCTILPGAALSVELVTLDGKRTFAGTVVSRKPVPFCWIDCQELNLKPVKFAESEAIAKPQNAFVALHHNGSVKLHPGSNASGGTFSSPASFWSQQRGIVFLGPVFATDGSCLGLGVRSDPKHAFKIYPLQRD